MVHRPPYSSTEFIVSHAPSPVMIPPLPQSLSQASLGGTLMPRRCLCMMTHACVVRPPHSDDAKPGLCPCGELYHCRRPSDAARTHCPDSAFFGQLGYHSPCFAARLRTHQLTIGVSGRPIAERHVFGRRQDIAAVRRRRVLERLCY